MSIQDRLLSFRRRQSTSRVGITQECMGDWENQDQINEDFKNLVCREMVNADNLINIGDQWIVDLNHLSHEAYECTDFSHLFYDAYVDRGVNSTYDVKLSALRDLCLEINT